MRKPYRYHLLPCGGPHCGSETGEAFKRQLKDLLPDRKALKVRISVTSCQGLCEHGPNLCVYPEGVVYHRLCPDDLPRIVEEHIRGGEPVEEILERRGEEPETP